MSGSGEVVDSAVATGIDQEAAAVDLAPDMPFAPASEPLASGEQAYGGALDIVRDAPESSSLLLNHTDGPSTAEYDAGPQASAAPDPIAANEAGTVTFDTATDLQESVVAETAAPDSVQAALSETALEGAEVVVEAPASEPAQAPDSQPAEAADNAEMSAEVAEDNQPGNQPEAVRDAAAQEDATVLDEASPEAVAANGLAAAVQAETAAADTDAESDPEQKTEPETKPAEPAPEPEPEPTPDNKPELGESGKLIEASPTLKGMVQPISEKAAEELDRAVDAAGGQNVWDLKAAGKDGRGFLIEDAVAAMEKETHPKSVHLEPRHPRVDLWDKDRGVVTSVKSLDPTLPTYQNLPKFEGKVREHLGKLQGYNPSTVNGEQVFARSIRGRELILAVPSTGVTKGHVERLEKVMTDPKYSGIILKIVEVKR